MAQVIPEPGRPEQRPSSCSKSLPTLWSISAAANPGTNSPTFYLPSFNGLASDRYRVELWTATRALVTDYVTIDSADGELPTDGIKEVASGRSGSVDAAQLDRIEAQTPKITGSVTQVVSNVKPGGQIQLHHGDDHTVALGNAVHLPVSDIGGSLHALMDAIAAENLSVAAILGSKKTAAKTINGTVAALNYADDVLTITIEFASAESSKGVVGRSTFTTCSRRTHRRGPTSAGN